MAKLSIRILVAALAAGTFVQAQANENLTTYLTARHASLNGQYSLAAELLEEVVANDPHDSYLLVQSLQAHLLAGNIDPVVLASRRVQASDANDALANTIHLIDLVRENNFAGAISVLQQDDRGFLVDPRIAVAWLHLGNEEFQSAFDALDEIEASADIKPIAEFQKALALGLSGDFEAANAILDEIGEDPPLTPEIVRCAHAQILVQLGRRERALEILDQGVASVSDIGRKVIENLRLRIEGGDQVDFDFVQSAAHGVSEMLKNISQFLAQRRAIENALVFGRFAELIDPHDAVLQIRLGEMLARLGAHQLALTSYGKVPDASYLYPAAVIGRASSHYRLGSLDRAVSELAALAETHGGSSEVLFALGNFQRLNKDFSGALESYDAAIAVVGDPADWTAYFFRGIVKERLGLWEDAKADLNRAIDLSGGRPTVLNYLGYSMVERRDSLDVAEDLIRRAVAEDQGNPYYIDSLGWVLYHTRRFEEAVRYMEKATRLMPDDPIVVDHLGDTYWMTSRQRQARDQWERALELNPDEDLEKRIRRKLDVGLDKVLEEEGLSILSDGN